MAKGRTTRNAAPECSDGSVEEPVGGGEGGGGDGEGGSAESCECADEAMVCSAMVFRFRGCQRHGSDDGGGGGGGDGPGSEVRGSSCAVLLAAATAPCCANRAMVKTTRGPRGIQRSPRAATSSWSSTYLSSDVVSKNSGHVAALTTGKIVSRRKILGKKNINRKRSFKNKNRKEQGKEIVGEGGCDPKGVRVCKNIKSIKRSFKNKNQKNKEKKSGGVGGVTPKGCVCGANN